MEIRVLRYFLTIAREGSITSAAEQLHITQPTLSRQIKDLEDELGQKMSSEIPVKGERVSVDETGRVSILSPNGKTTVWSWGGWGLALIEEYSMEG